MEEKQNLTAERSLEIITEQIARNRKAVSQVVGEHLVVAGIATMAMAVVVALINWACGSQMGHLLWFVLPLIIWLLSRRIRNNYDLQPNDLIGSLVSKTWNTFAVFTLGFFALALICNIFTSMVDVDPSSRMYIRVGAVVMLLMGVAVTITGHILKSKALVWFGIISGLLMYFWETFGFTSMILLRLGVQPEALSTTTDVVGCLPILIIAFIGLLLPGLALKKQEQ